METKRHDKHLRSDTTTTDNSEVSKPSNTFAVGESNDNLEFSGVSGKPSAKPEKESHRECTELESRKYLEDKETEDKEFMVDENIEVPRKKLPKDSSDSESKVSLSNSEIMDAKAPNESSLNMKESDIKLKDLIVGENIGASTSEQESKQMDMQFENGENQMASRSAASKKRTRSLSPDTDVNNGDKRPTAICNFYAKGWCIKGSSCSFLHIKDNGHSSDHHPNDVGAAYLKKQAQPNEGQYSAGTLKSPVFHHPLDSSFKNESPFSSKFDLSSEKTFPRDFAESQGWDELHDVNKFLLHQREDSFLSPLSDHQKLPSTSLGPSFPSNRGSSMLRNGLPPEVGLSFSNHINGTPSSRSGVMEELVNVAHPHLPNDHPPILKTTLFADSTLLMRGMMSSRFSTSNAPSFPFTSSSLSASLLGTQKMSTIDRREHRISTPASLMRSSSSFSASESDKSLTNVSMNSSEYKMKYSSNDWEPSIPFRPSFFIPSIHAASQYDPFLDSIEVPRIVGGADNASVNCHGHEEASALGTLHRASGNFIVPGSSGPEINDDTNSLSSRYKVIENKIDQTFYVHGMFTGDAERRGSSGIDVPKGSGTGEDDHMGLTHEKDITKIRKVDADGELRLPNAALHEKDYEADSERRFGDMDAKHLMDGDVHKESKATRHFRAALIELVKELLKPKWREGHLKKDVHNTVVKKTLDKVLGTLQSHQIPTTVESVKQYLTSSRPKIAKLVEGYVSKYGKS